VSIAIAISVHDGIVLAADSASTLSMMAALPGPQRMPIAVPGAMNVYNNANKISNLYKSKPIGCVVYGSGSIGNASISTLLKDFRDTLVKREEQKAPVFDPENYTMQEVSQRLADFLAKQVTALRPNEPKPTLGIILGGYSAKNNSLGEVWSIGIQNGVSSPPDNLRKDGPVGISWGGEVESIVRLLMGFSPRLQQILQKVAPGQDVNKLMTIIGGALQAPLVFAPMPIQDTIDLAEWLVQTAIMYSRFSPGAPVVGSPIESAAITKHEGFKWIHRKHYYQSEFNPEIPKDDH
jgi:hypothetical protein